jgi:hypothetical protein
VQLSTKRAIEKNLNASLAYVLRPVEIIALHQSLERRASHGPTPNKGAFRHIFLEILTISLLSIPAFD